MSSPGTTSAHRGAMRVWRALGVAVVATVPAGVLHGVAHGHTPALEAFALGILLTLALATPLVGRTARNRRTARIRSGLAIGGSQAIFHVLFSVVTGGVGTGLGGGQHLHHDPEAIRAALAGASSASVLDQAHATLTPAMLAAHALAAALTIGAVWYGEQLLAGILDAGAQQLAALGRLVARVRTAAAPSAPARLVIATDLAPRIGLRLAATLPGRAPPLAA